MRLFNVFFTAVPCEHFYGSPHGSCVIRHHVYRKRVRSENKQQLYTVSNKYRDGNMTRPSKGESIESGIIHQRFNAHHGTGSDLHAMLAPGANLYVWL